MWFGRAEDTKVDAYLRRLAVSLGGKKEGWIVEGKRNGFLYKLIVMGSLAFFPECCLHWDPWILL